MSSFSDLRTTFQTSQFKLVNLAVPYLHKSHHMQELLWPLWNETTAEVQVAVG